MTERWLELRQEEVWLQSNFDDVLLNLLRLAYGECEGKNANNAISNFVFLILFLSPSMQQLASINTSMTRFSDKLWWVAATGQAYPVHWLLRQRRRGVRSVVRNGKRRVVRVMLFRRCSWHNDWFGWSIDWLINGGNGLEFLAGGTRVDWLIDWLLPCIIWRNI